jgi:hypothetical protein
MRRREVGEIIKANGPILSGDLPVIRRRLEAVMSGSRAQLLLTYQRLVVTRVPHVSRTRPP